MPKEKKWFYARGRQRFGPISEKQIEDMIERGYILRNSLVWTKGFEKWRHADNTELLRYIEATEVPRAATGSSDNSSFPLRFDFDGRISERVEQTSDTRNDAHMIQIDEKLTHDEIAVPNITPEINVNNADISTENNTAVTHVIPGLEDEPPERSVDGDVHTGFLIHEHVRETVHLLEQSPTDYVNDDEIFRLLGDADAPETYGTMGRIERRSGIGCLNIFCIIVIILSAIIGATMWFIRGNSRIDSSTGAWDYLDRKLNLSNGYIYDKTLSAGCLDVKVAENGLATVKTVDGKEANGYFVFTYPLWCATDNEAKMSHYAMFIISRDGSVYFRDSSALLFYNGPFLKVARLMSPSGVKIASQSDARTHLSITLQRPVSEYQGNGMAVFYPTDGGGLGLGYYFTRAADGSDYYVTEDGHSYTLRTVNSKTVENGPFKGALIHESIYEEVVPNNAGTPTQAPISSESVMAEPVTVRSADERSARSHDEVSARIGTRSASDEITQRRRVEVAVITATRVNFRQLPSTTSAIIGKLTSGDKIEVLNRQKTSDEYEWLLVEWNGRRGWVYGQFVKKE